MSKKINTKSLLQARASLSPATYTAFKNYFGVAIKDQELTDLQILVNAMTQQGGKTPAFDHFLLGYKIPQIGKEFDLLRLGKNSVINVELKQSSTVEKIKKQLLRNMYYLSFLGRSVHTFAFESQTNRLYRLNDEELVLTEIEELIQLLQAQEIDPDETADELFNPSVYLVSPFNSTDRFLSGKYFLTHQQEEVKALVLEALGGPKKARYFSITGSAGTGKTLLTFDIAKSLISKGMRALILHCGQLNEGHWKLVKAGWHVAPIKSQKDHDIAKFDVVIVDEAQRIYEHQLTDIVDRVKAADSCCIFSYDKVQTLAKSEEKRGISEKIAAIQDINAFKLSEKIRTNAEISAFIKQLFKKQHLQKTSGRNIEVSYFSSQDDAREYLGHLSAQGWEVLRFTPSQYNAEYHEKYFDSWSKTSHQVIGQEFDSVAVAVDPFFTYNESGELAYRAGTYYEPAKMLFQNLTRARKKLSIVIFGNQELLQRCMEILD